MFSMPKPKIGHVFEIFRGFDIKARADFQIFRKWVFYDGEKDFFKKGLRSFELRTQFRNKDFLYNFHASLQTIFVYL